MRQPLRLAVLVLVSVSAMLGMPLRAAEVSAPEGSSRIVGWIFGSEPEVRRAGVQVLAYHLSSQQLFTSTPTDVKGHYEMTGLPRGYFDIAVQTDEGLYVADQVVELSYEGKAVLSLALTAVRPASITPTRRFAGREDLPVGIAALSRKNPGGFVRGKTGAALLAGGGAVALLALGGGSDDDASPSEP